MSGPWQRGQVISPNITPRRALRHGHCGFSSDWLLLVSPVEAFVGVPSFESALLAPVPALLSTSAWGRARAFSLLLLFAELVFAFDRALSAGGLPQPVAFGPVLKPPDAPITLSNALRTAALKILSAAWSGC